MPCLNAAFSVDSSVSSFLNMEMLKSLKVSSIMAFFAWCLVLPPFFTPATLYVYPSTNAFVVVEPVGLLQINNATEGSRFAYSPPTERATINKVTDERRTFTGPRTILTLLAGATASLGEILPIKPPYNHSSYSVQMYAPIVRCDSANESTEALIDSLLQTKMREKVGTATQTENAYWAFVPVYDANGTLQAVDKPRNQAPSNATNQIWMRIQRYSLSFNGTRARETIHQVCQVYNASYDAHLSWDHGFQNITGSYEVLNRVDYPRDVPVSDLVQHSYSAFLWVIADQVVGTFGWFENLDHSDSDGMPAQFGSIDSALKSTSLLGTSDLDLYSNLKLKGEKNLYGEDRTENGTLGDQRQQDKALAKNRTMDLLIEELSFNLTLSLLHNPLLK